MFKKILVPLDGSENAERVLPWVRLYGSASKSLIVPLRVVDPALRSSRDIAMEKNDAGEYLRGVFRELNFQGMPVRPLIRLGDPADTIVETAERYGCDLVALTTRGGSPVARWVIGGTAEKLLRRSHVPVLLTQSHTAPPKQARVRRIVVPLDGSALAERILPWVRELARFHRARIQFLHVMPRRKPDFLVKFLSNCAALSKRVEAECANLKARNIRASLQVRRGDPADEILRAAAEPASMVAMTTHGLGGFDRFVYGSVAEKVIHSADTAVFVHKGAAPD
jgi:nucleotide-binding universal stress UspA family protein